jgi:hypothetical protein
MLIDDFPVASGDLIYCRLTVRTADRRRINFLVKNQSSGRVIAFDVDAPKPRNPGRSDNIAAEGRTAEWILERPTKLGSKEMFPLPDYGATLFYACNAAIKTDTGWEELQLEQARLMSIKDWDGPNPGATVSTSVRQNESSILLCYEGNVP